MLQIELMASDVYDRQQTKKTIITALILIVVALIVYALVFGSTVASIGNKAVLAILGFTDVVIILLSILFVHD